MVDREDYIKALITVYRYETAFCSAYHHARKVSSTSNRLVKLGEEVVPALLMVLSEGEGDMHIMQLLGEITKEWPSAPADKPIEDTGFTATNVAQARDLWVAWGKEKGLV